MNPAENDSRHPIWADEDRLRRFVNVIGFTRCVIGPLVLFGLLVGTAYWEPAGDATQAASVPAHYTSAAGGAEAHVRAF